MSFSDDQILLYDLSNRPASFDFVTCLATAITHGAKHVRFVLGGWKPKNYTNPEQRFKSIVEPACALYGIGYSVGERQGVEHSHFLNKAIAAYRQCGRIAKIQPQKTPLKSRDNYVTITLRKSRNPERDSNETEWLRFASRCSSKAIVLRDYDERPLDLADRMQLYAGARMNFMVINGPLTLCIHSEAPYLSMRTIGCERSGSTSPAHMARLGITPGFQFPWANRLQRLSYADDTCENIEREWGAMIQRRMAA